MEGGDLRWFWSGFDVFERIDNVSICAILFTWYRTSVTGV